jgi:hypothetical protein
MRIVYRSDVPTNGGWFLGDKVVNNAWEVGQPLFWTCIGASDAGTWSPTYETESELAGVGADEGATVTATEASPGVHQTVLTLDQTVVTVANTTGASFGGTKLYTFPEGRILILGVAADLSIDWSAALDEETPIISLTGSGDLSIGTTITDDATLDGTDVDLLPSTAMLDPFVDGVGSASGALAASAQFDGTTTPVELNLNMIIDDADVEDATTADVLVSGTVTVTWVNLGDY